MWNICGQQLKLGEKWQGMLKPNMEDYELRKRKFGEQYGTYFRKVGRNSQDGKRRT